jgi:hypothetical protein
MLDVDAAEEIVRDELVQALGEDRAAIFQCRVVETETGLAVHILDPFTLVEGSHEVPVLASGSPSVEQSVRDAVRLIQKEMVRFSGA